MHYIFIKILNIFFYNFQSLIITIFFKDSNIILNYSILGDYFGLKKHVYR